MRLLANFVLLAILSWGQQEPLRGQSLQNDPQNADNVDALRISIDLKLLLTLDKRLKEQPEDKKISEEAAAVALRLAPELPGHPVVWDLLIRTRVLKHGVTTERATEILGSE